MRLAEPLKAVTTNTVIHRDETVCSRSLVKNGYIFVDPKDVDSIY